MYKLTNGYASVPRYFRRFVLKTVKKNLFELWRYADLKIAKCSDSVCCCLFLARLAVLEDQRLKFRVFSLLC